MAPNSENATASRTLPVRFGRFVVERELGSGASSTVYLVTDTNLGVKAALKQLHLPEGHDEALVQEAFREALTANMVDHPGIAKIWAYDRLQRDDIGQLHHCLVMQYCEGETLRRWIGRFAQRDYLKLSVLYHISHVISEVHRKNIVHRDLKPENIIIKEDDNSLGGVRVTVIDFGIARLANRHENSSAALTQSRGTPEYIPPEIWLSSREAGVSQWTPAADVYAFGILCFEILTGHHPLGIAPGTWSLARQRDIADRHINAAASALPRGTPLAIATLIKEALDKNPDVRPSMETLCAALRGSLLTTPKTQFEHAYDEWRVKRRKLLNDDELESARELERAGEIVFRGHVEFFKDSVRASIRRQRRRTLALCSVTLLLVTLGLSIVAAMRFQAESSDAKRNTALATLDKDRAIRYSEIESTAKRDLQHGYDACRAELRRVDEQLSSTNADLTRVSERRGQCEVSRQTAQAMLGRITDASERCREASTECDERLDACKYVTRKFAGELADAQDKLEKRTHERDQALDAASLCAARSSR
jgi:serine/threonine protein kinase